MVKITNISDSWINIRDTDGCFCIIKPNEEVIAIKNNKTGKFEKLTLAHKLYILRRQSSNIT